MKNKILTILALLALLAFGDSAGAQIITITNTTPFPTVLSQINYNFGYLNTNGGGGGSNGNFILKVSGTGNNLTITNPLTLIDQTANQIPGTGFPIEVITGGWLTNFSNGCLNGQYNIDSNTLDYTWAMLTNNCGYVLIFFPFNTNGTIGGIPQHGVDTTSTNYTWTETNQVMGNLQATITGATNYTADTPLNGTYTPSAAPQVLTFANGLTLLQNTNPVSPTPLMRGEPVAGPIVAYDLEGWLSGIGRAYYFTPLFLWKVYISVPHFNWPLYHSFAGFGSTSGGSPDPFVSLSYTITNGWMTDFIATNLADVLTTNYTMTITTNNPWQTNISSVVDWVVLAPNTPSNYTVVSYNPAGSFRWLNDYFSSNICAACPAVPFYPTTTPIDTVHLNYFCQESGGCWSTIVNGATNLGCAGCIPVYQHIEKVPPGTERIPGPVTISTNLNPPLFYSYATVLTGDTASQLNVNGVPVLTTNGTFNGIVTNLSSSTVSNRWVITNGLIRSVSPL